MIILASHEVSCSHCDYVWISRVESPKSCPRCKGRLDKPTAKVVKGESPESKGYMSFNEWKEVCLEDHMDPVDITKENYEKDYAQFLENKRELGL